MILLAMVLGFFSACDKVIDVDLPAYDQELVVEMYLERGRPLRCLLMESLPYTDTAINKPVNNALVIISDGTRNDTLRYQPNQEPETGRYFNYYHPRLIDGDPDRTYTLTITAENKKAVGSTRFSQEKISFDSLVVRESLNQPDSFSVGLVFKDPPGIDNYYRMFFGNSVNFTSDDPTDVRLNDISFNGKTFSFYSEPDFARNDTVVVRLYSLSKEHYDYLESTGNARRSNFNPFSQPGRIKSNVTGGLGIFAPIVYSERTIIIR